MAADVNTYQAGYQSAPMQTFAETTFTGPETPMDTFAGSTFDNLTSTMSNYTEISSSLPSFPETYNIHGTYTYMRDEPKSEFGSFGREAASPSSGGEKFSATMHYQGQYEAYSEEAYLKQGGFVSVDNHEFYPKGAPGAFQGGSFPPGTSMPGGYTPDQKDNVYQHAAGFQSNQQLFHGTDRQGFQGYQPGYYDNQRLAGADTNFNFPSHGGIYHGDISVQMARGPYQRRPSMTLGSPDSK